MPTITVRNLSEDTHRALAARAARHGRSTAAEAGAIIEEALWSPDGPKLGTALVELFGPLGGVGLDIRRDSWPVELIGFEE